ncbi:hypothetical protein TIFTF001_020081 [Ficus carica]|uniref:Uncharacterized protein n=1 Tax=Ficus carica TaxID=3494 RepID=A0AA88ACY5_FICCA|nr:hypothetical protein TIFTF001_020081 [Ficus carica]
MKAINDANSRRIQQERSIQKSYSDVPGREKIGAGDQRPGFQREGSQRFRFFFFFFFFFFFLFEAGEAFLWSD